MVKNFYIFRHGQSSYNLEGRIQGHTNNSVLTNQGIDEAHNAASLLQDKKIEIVVSFAAPPGQTNRFHRFQND